MKICAYVQDVYAKANYKNECLDTRAFAGLRVIIDCLNRSGYEVDYAGKATVHQYNIVLVSLTSDCDWWSFIGERVQWKDGDYKVLIGGAGVLHVTPFTRFGDYFMVGRGENLIVPLVKAIERGDDYRHESVIESKSFSPNNIYKIAQVDEVYKNQVELAEGKKFVEGAIGCNHKCLFCGYTWHRKFVSQDKTYKMADDLFGGIEDKERAMLDLNNDPNCIDWARLRTTAIDGLSERLRKMVHKPITKEIMSNFLDAMLAYEGKAHQIKFYNIVGYPTETIEDWEEYVDTIREADRKAKARETQWSIVLHSTPFRAMPATPMACKPMSKRNYRGELGRILGKGLKGNLIYQGKNVWSVESMGTDSLSTVMLSAIAHRGGEQGSENIVKLCRNRKFWAASSAVKEATLCKYFDMDYLFGEFTTETLPSRYLRTYAKVEKMW